jgi:hypothetical protein
VAEAAYQAQDILNYSMRGDYTAARALAQTAPFWNAGMQGLYRFMRGAGIANAKAGDTSQLQSFMLRGSVWLAATLANAWRNQDDPRYQRLSNDDKDRYWHFSAYDRKTRRRTPDTSSCRSRSRLASSSARCPSAWCSARSATTPRRTR